MATTQKIKSFVQPVAGIDSTTAPLPLYPMPNAQYSDYAFAGIEIPTYYTSIASIKLYFKRESAGNAYLRFRISQTDTDSPPSTQISDVDSLTVYAGGSTDGKITTLTIPAAAYNGLTFDSGDVLAVKVERDASDATDTYEADFQIAFIEVSFNVSMLPTYVVGDNDIISLGEVKDYLAIEESDTTHDVFLQRWITDVSTQIEQEIDNVVIVQTITGEIHDGNGRTKLRPNFYPIVGLGASSATDAEQLAALQYLNDDTWTDLATDVDDILFNNPGVTYQSEQNSYNIELPDGSFPSGRRNIALNTYRAGWSTVPVAIKTVCLEKVVETFRNSSKEGGGRFGITSTSKSEGIGNKSTTYKDFTERQKKFLDPYRRKY